MKVDLSWVLLITLLIALGVWRLSALAGRLDRVHHRIDVATGSLDAQLVRRARSAEALATSGLIDPASAIVLARAASNCRHAESADPIERGIIESEMSRDLREVFADADEVAALRAAPDGAELVDDLASACRQVALARRFLNDGVAAARLLRSQRQVRVFRLAGRAPWPRTFEMDDRMPEALAAHF